MSFELTERIIAVQPQDVQTLFGALLVQFGEELPDGPRMVRTLAGHWDDTAKTRLRAASLTDGTITPQPLTDGRVAFRALWESTLAAAFDNGQITGAQQLTEAELAALTPPPVS